MKKEIYNKIIDNLKGINYFFISGMSVAVYSNKKRKPRDMDIAIDKKDIDKFAEIMGTKAEKRLIDKGEFIVQDYGFVVIKEGQEIEVTTGYPKKRMLENTFDKLFKIKVKKNYLGREIFVEPIEELITQKAFMYRKKDIKDLKLLRNIKFDKKLLIELAKDKGKEKEILNILDYEGFKL